MEPGQCFFPREFAKGITTPMFILNPAYDSWQTVAEAVEDWLFDQREVKEIDWKSVMTIFISNGRNMCVAPTGVCQDGTFFFKFFQICILWEGTGCNVLSYFHLPKII